MKLYLVTREDLSPGQQAVQAAHALRLFTEEHPSEDRLWYEQSKTLILLAAKDERALMSVWRKAKDKKIAISEFHEPDLCGELTALAVGPLGQNILRSFPLALSRKA